MIFSVTGTRYPNTSRNFWLQNYWSRQLQVQRGFYSFVFYFFFNFWCSALSRRWLSGVLLSLFDVSWELLKSTWNPNRIHQYCGMVHHFLVTTFIVCAKLPWHHNHIVFVFFLFLSFGPDITLIKCLKGLKSQKSLFVSKF